MAQTKGSTKKSTAKPSGGSVQRTRKQNAESGFRASQRLSDCLQRVLVDLIELQLQGKQAHWNVVGANFRDTHLQLDEIVAAGRALADTVAERMRAMHAVPDGRSSTVAGTTSLPPFPQGEVDTTSTIDLITERLDGVASTVRDVHDAIDEEDPTTADILHAVLEQIEQFAWMVSAENRTPA